MIKILNALLLEYTNVDFEVIIKHAPAIQNEELSEPSVIKVNLQGSSRLPCDRSEE